jgi:tRNA threonylcarbamoyl adenosine modification protein YeaZ
MNILALEFSSPVRSVAVARLDPAGVAVLGTAESAFDESDRQSSDALTLVDQALRAGGIDRAAIGAVVVGLGPGSYTGIRGAISLAQGWELATDARLLGIGSAAAIAAGALSAGVQGRVGVVIDAQRGEFYLAGFELGTEVRASAPLRLASAAEVAACRDSGALLVGPEVTRWFPEGRVIAPRAAALAALAAGRDGFVTGGQLEPIYLRTPQFVKAPPPRPLPTH